MTKTVFETAAVKPSKRFPLWSQVLTSLCGPVKAAGSASASFEGRIEMRTLTRLKLSRIVASAHRLSSVADASADEERAAIKAILQLRGGCILEQGATRVCVSAGECLVFDVSRPHTIVSPSSSEHLVVIIPKDLAASFDLYPTGVGSLRFATQRGIAHVTRELIEASLDEPCEPGSSSSEQIADLLLRSLSISLDRERSRLPISPRTALVRRAKRYIDENLADPSLDIERVADAMACSRRHLQLAFADEGTTMSNYLWASRLESCRREILKSAGRMSLTQLAFSHGFSSSSHFSRSFRQKYGVSPSAMLLKFLRNGA